MATRISKFTGIRCIPSFSNDSILCIYSIEKTTLVPNYVYYNGSLYEYSSMYSDSRDYITYATFKQSLLSDAELTRICLECNLSLYIENLNFE